MSRNIQLRPPPGANEETARVFAELQAQLAVTIGELQRDFERRLSALETEPAGVEVKTSSFTARAGQVVTVEPPPAGLTVTLPAASAITRRARVVVTSRNSNPVRWESARGTVNGVRQVTSNAPGAAEAICDGEAWHVSLGAATATGSAASTAGAKYFLEEADTGLPNARVADDSTELDLDYTSPGVVSWFLKTASVVFAKLQDLTGLSVLGRAANSSGVMAAITASGARQVLRANDAGTALEWGYPVQASDSGSDIGDFFDLNFIDGTGTFANVSAPGSGRANIQFNWNGLYVFDNASFVNYFQGLRFDDGTGTVAVVTSSAPTGVVRFDWDGVTNLVTGWDGVLAIGNSSGANDVQIDVGQHLNLGATGPTTSDPQIRSGDATFRIRGGGNTFVLADGSVAALASTTAGSTALLQAQGAGSVAQVSGGGSVVIDSGGSVRLEFTSAGAWELDGTDPGASGEVLTSAGAGAPPVWAAVDLSSVTYLAGDGLDLSSNTFSVDVADFAGTGLEADGSNNLRIAAAAAGAGLTGGAGSALAVGAGSGISVAADSVAVDRAADFGTNGSTAWAGNHRFEARVELIGHTFWKQIVGLTLSANADDVDMANANVLRIVGNGFSLTGMAPNRVGTAGDGHLVLIVNADSGDPLFIANESASSTSNNRFSTPGGVTYVMPPKSAVWARYDSNNDRWYLLAGGEPSPDAAATDDLVWVDENFDGANSGIATLATTGLLAQPLDNQQWHVAASVARGSWLAVNPGATGHNGVQRLSTGTTNGDIAAVYHGRDPASAVAPSSEPSIAFGDISRVDWWVRLGSTTSCQARVGLATNAVNSNFGTDAAYFQFTSGTANWSCRTRAVSTGTSADSGVAATTGWVKLTLILRNSGSQVVFAINNVIVATNTTNLPGSSTLVSPAAATHTTTAAAKAIDVDRCRVIVPDEALI